MEAKGVHTDPRERVRAMMHLHDSEIQNVFCCSYRSASLQLKVNAVFAAASIGMA
jgi:hypothetical protein